MQLDWLRLTPVRLVIAVIVLAVLGPLGTCAYLHSTHPFNSVRNDLSDKLARCEGTRFVAPFGDTVAIWPGETREVASNRCTVMKLYGSGYYGCLEVGKARGQVLLASTYDPAVDYFDCEGELQ
jgi:hypothetical protein